MKFAYTIIYVPDVERALAFYQSAFGLKRRFIDEKGQYGGDTIRMNTVWQEAMMLPIGCAREEPKPVEPSSLEARSQKQTGGYVLEVFIPSAALTGFEPTDHPRLGFTYLVNDRELGQQTFSCPSEFPFAVDPSLWGTLELVE